MDETWLEGEVTKGRSVNRSSKARGVSLATPLPATPHIRVQIIKWKETIVEREEENVIS